MLMWRLSPEHFQVFSDSSPEGYTQDLVFWSVYVLGRIRLLSRARIKPRFFLAVCEADWKKKNQPRPEEIFYQPNEDQGDRRKHQGSAPLPPSVCSLYGIVYVPSVAISMMLDGKGSLPLKKKLKNCCAQSNTWNRKRVLFLPHFKLNTKIPFLSNISFSS